MRTEKAPESKYDLRCETHYVTNLNSDDRKGTFRCLACGREFPMEYEAKKLRYDRKVYGTRQLMRLHASNNFYKHAVACWKAKVKKEGGRDE